MNRDLRVPVVILSLRSPRLERIFWRLIFSPLEGRFGFLAKNDGNHGENMRNIVWIVIYACPRSFWAPNRRDWKAFSDGFKLAPSRAILCFWAITMKIMPKSRLILYESWSTRARGYFERKIAAIGENFLTGPNWPIGGPFCVFVQKRWKSWRNHR